MVGNARLIAVDPVVLRGRRLRLPAWPVFAATATVCVVALELPFSALAVR